MCWSGNRLPSRGSIRGDNVLADSRELVTERQSGIVGEKDWQEFQALSRRDVPFSLVDHHGAALLDNAESQIIDLHKVSHAECHGFSTLERREIVPVERRDMGYKNLHAVSGDSRGICCVHLFVNVFFLPPLTACHNEQSHELFLRKHP